MCVAPSEASVRRQRRPRDVPQISSNRLCGSKSCVFAPTTDGRDRRSGSFTRMHYMVAEIVPKPAIGLNTD